MAVRYVVRALAGTLIIQIGPPPPSNALVKVRNGTIILRIGNGLVVLYTREP